MKITFRNCIIKLSTIQFWELIIHYTTSIIYYKSWIPKLMDACYDDTSLFSKQTTMIHDCFLYFIGIYNLYLYTPKSWNVALIVTTFWLSQISIHLIIIFLSNFLIIIFNIYFKIYIYIYTFFNSSLSLTFSSSHYPLH